jgi:hypothetical protein
MEGDSPRPPHRLAEMVRACRDRGTNLPLDVPPNREGGIPRETVAALTKLRKDAGI